MLRYQVWLLIKFNILVSLEDIVALQKSLFSHTFLCDSSLSLVLEK